MKIVTDADVLFRAVLSKNLRTASRFVFEMIIGSKVQAYTCDVLLGEIFRVVDVDPKLKKVNKVYFQEFMGRLQTYLTYVPMKELEHDEKMLNEIGNDWYLIAVAKSISASYIVTYDKHLHSRKAKLLEENDIIVNDSEGFERDFKPAP
jgi:predicted nucleic acid-binding protein